MKTLEKLFNNNRCWAEEMTSQDANFFSKLAQLQRPHYLWIGCSDSRVPANQIVGLPPGELFVHRNVANVVVPSDLNCLSVIQFAVDILEVSHIIVCGHYGCSGVHAALHNRKIGISDNWLRHVQDVKERFHSEIDALDNEADKHHRLCELNVIAQLLNVSKTSVVRQAWQRKQPLTLHGWIYDINDGLLRDLSLSLDSEETEALSTYSQIPPKAL